jgi:hypothetical protein
MDREQLVDLVVVIAAIAMVMLKLPLLVLQVREVVVVKAAVSITLVAVAVLAPLVLTLQVNQTAVLESFLLFLALIYIGVEAEEELRIPLALEAMVASVVGEVGL